MDDRITGKKRKWVYQQITIEENQSSEEEEASSESDSDYSLSSSTSSEEEMYVLNPEIGEQDESLRIKEDILHEIIGHQDSLRERILKADLDDQRKAVIYEEYETLQKITDGSITAVDIETWIEEALKIPFTKVKSTVLNTESPTECLLRLKNSFENHLSHMDRVVEPLLSVINNRLRNSESEPLVLGLLGSPGVGKTATGRAIAEAWDLPFQQISLGGMLDSSLLTGQHRGWVGSQPGRVVRALQQMGVINGILFLDEVDKLGKTSQGMEVQYSLLHLTDPTQNKEYIDNYLGSKLPIDLSKVIFICALNKTDGLDPALLNRMHIIKIPDYTSQQKTEIMVKHLFPEALKTASLTADDIILPTESCLEIQRVVEQQNGKEGGVRGIKRCLQVIVNKLSLLIGSRRDNQSLGLSFNVEIQQLPIQINSEVIQELYKPDAPPKWTNLYS